MGRSISYRCPNCGHEHTSSNGVGYLFPMVYMETVEKAKAGVLGEEIRIFFENHPDGAINAENVTLRCDTCGHLAGGQDLSMHVPKSKEGVRLPAWGSGADAAKERQYVMEEDLEEFYTKIADYPHKCKKCGGSMHVVRPDEELLCPDCGSPMDINPDSLMLWD